MKPSMTSYSKLTKYKRLSLSDKFNLIKKGHLPLWLQSYLITYIIIFILSPWKGLISKILSSLFLYPIFSGVFMFLTYMILSLIIEFKEKD